jgi:glycosyltransferase involved in cell wall biosynthesis
LWDVAAKLNVRTVLHANFEFWDPTDRPTVLAAPSLWNLDRFPPGTVHLPVPVETDRFTPEPHPTTAQHFLHVVGRPAIHDRNGTLDVLRALQHVTSPITVTITCQQHGYVGGLINDNGIQIPAHIKLNVESGDVENYWDNYHHIDALILPRRFGGLCLPANEAIGAGIPVIMPDIDPNNTWLPKAWLVPAELAGDFWAKQQIFFYRTDQHLLAQKIEQLATDEDFYGHSLWTAENLRAAMSWEALEPRYRELL